MPHRALPLVALLGLACERSAADPPAETPTAPTLSDPVQVVPGAGLPVEPQPANNNLDVIEHDGAVFLAFRTAPTHFASSEVELHVLRSTDEQTWTHELTVSRERDLREPRFLVWNGELHLYFALLGTSSVDFEPGGSMRTVRGADGAWSDPEEVFTEAIFEGDFIPWRARTVDGRAMVVGYSGGAGVYDLDDDTAGGDVLPQIDVHWLSTSDGHTWDGWVPGSPVVYTGGGSETDLTFTDDGGVVAVMRNEAGDEDGWGSKICTAPPEDLATWTCSHDPKKYDSPLVFSHGGRAWLIGRRTLEHDGAYDLEMRDRSHAEQSLAYQAAYWNAPKRCSLWEIDPATRTVSWVLDLASRGDTCFASILPLDQDSYAVYNYSSPVDGPDLNWLDGQLGETHIYRQVLTFQ